LTSAERPVASAQRRAFPLRFGWAPGIRLIVALLISGPVTLALALAQPRQLKLTTDVVGYPIYADYNIERLINLYYIGVLFFPVFALVLYLAQTWLVRRMGLAERHISRVQAADEVEVPESGRRAVAVGLARALAVGSSLGLEVAIVADATHRYFWLTLAVVAVAYCGAVLGVAWLMRRFSSTTHDLTTAAGMANALAAPLVLLGLWGVSASTAVTIASTGTVRGYPWMPWWLAAVMTIAALAWIWSRLSAARGAAAIRAVERGTVLFLTAPVSLFVLRSGLPGDPGFFDVFHEGEGLVGARLTSAGFLYWRDLLSTHGILQDIVTPLVGLRIFEDSRWGFWAGFTVLVAPLAYTLFFLFGAWLFERSWAFVLALMAVVMSLQFITLDTRFTFWPLILLWLGLSLRRRSSWMTAVLGAGLTAQAILVPESAYCVPAIGVTVILYDLAHRQAGAKLAATFAHTLWLTAGGVALFALFALYLASQHALGDFFFYYLIFVPGHELVGGLHVTLRAFGPLFTIFAIAPPIAFLLGFFYYAMLVIRRQPLSVRDWVIGAAAIFAIPYYTKYLERADLGHGEQAYGAAVPLIMYLIYRACTYVDAAIARSGWLRRAGFNAVRQPVAVVALVAALVPAMTSNAYHTAPPLADWLGVTAEHYRPVVAVPPQVARIGYGDGGIDPATVSDMQAVFNAYLQPGDWVFDFSNEPALTYYLLDQTPQVRYYHATMAITERAQKDLISELQRHPPKLVVFNDETYGLLNWDDIPSQVRHYEVSQYILDHYTPLLSTHTQILYGLTSAQLSPDVALSLPLQQPVQTQNLDFSGFSCDWGYAPNFLSISPGGQQPQVSPVTLTTQPSPDGSITFVGWAGDPATGQPARQIVLTSAGKVIGTVAPSLDRPDVVKTFGQAGLGTSGYRLTAAVPDTLLSDPNGIPSLRVYGIFAAGVATELLGSPGATGPAVNQITLEDGTTVPVRGGGLTGAVDTITPYHQVQIAPPPGSSWADYRWLEIETSTRFNKDGWALYDVETGDPGHQILFRTLGNTSTTIRVFVGSCAQWHGYGAMPVILGHGVGEDISAVRLLP
jgi:hypothetical protein